MPTKMLLCARGDCDCWTCSTCVPPWAVHCVWSDWSDLCVNVIKMNEYSCECNVNELVRRTNS